MQYRLSPEDAAFVEEVASFITAELDPAMARRVKFGEPVP